MLSDADGRTPLHYLAAVTGTLHTLVATSAARGGQRMAKASRKASKKAKAVPVFN